MSDDQWRPEARQGTADGTDAAYGQGGQQSYGQPAQQPYGQPDQAAYGQGGQSAYGPQAGYGQPGYGQPGQQPYGQAGWQPSGQHGYAAPGSGPQQPGPQQYAGQPYPGQTYPAYGYPPRTYLPGAKSKIAAGLLGIFLGGLGVHNFYLGYTGKAVAQLLLTVLGWMLLGMGPIAAYIWGLVEGILILASRYGSPWHRDGHGVELND